MEPRKTPMARPMVISVDMGRGAVVVVDAVVVVAGSVVVVAGAAVVVATVGR